MYKFSYCIYSISHIIKKPFSSNQDKWLGWKDWLNKKFCDKFMEMNTASMSTQQESTTQQKEPTTPEQNKNIQELNNLTKAGANPQSIGSDSRFNEKVEILPCNQYLMNFLKQSKFDFGLSSYNACSQLMKAIRKTLTAETLEEMREGKFAIDYLLDKQVSDDDEELVIEDCTAKDDELIIDDINESVGPKQQISNNKDDISKKALGEAWIAAVRLTTEQSFMDLRKKFSLDKVFIYETGSDVIKKLYEQDNSILNYTDNQGNNAVHIAASSSSYNARQGLLRTLEKLNQSSANQLKLKTNKAGYNTLQMAVVCKHPDMVYHLLQRCTSDQKQTLLTTPDQVGNNPLHLAVIVNDNEVVDELLRRCTSDQKQTLLTTPDQVGNNPLHLAVIVNDNEVVDELLRRCTPEQKQSLLTAVNHQGNTPIMEAINNSKLKELESQVTTEQFANKCMQLIRSQPTSETTVSKRMVQIVETKSQLCDTENGKAKKLTRGEIECKIRDTEFSELMRRLDSEDKTQYTTSNLIKSDNKTLAIMRKNNLSVFNKLLSHSDLEKDGQKFLEAAIINNNKVIVSSLLDQEKVDVNSCDEQGKSLLELTIPQYGVVIYHEKIEMLGLLIGKGANVNIKNNEGKTLLYNAVDITQPSKYEIIKYLFNKGALANLRDNNGNTVLHLAAQIGDANSISLLMQNGADINIQNAQGETPLHIALSKAITYNQYRIVKVLLKYQADPNVQNNAGNMVLQRVIKDGRPELIEILKKAGTKFNIKDNEGNTSLHYAIQNPDPKVSENLLAIGDNASIQDKQADINSRNAQGDTTLHIAVRDAILHHGPLKVKLLMKSEADVGIVNNEGDTPLDIVVKTGNPQNDSHIEILNVLLEKIDHELANKIYPMIMNKLEEINYVNLNMLYVFAQHLVKQKISLEITDEQLECLIHKNKNQVEEAIDENENDREEGEIVQEVIEEEIDENEEVSTEKKLAFILKAFYIQDENKIPVNIKELMDGISLNETIDSTIESKKSSRNVVVEQKKDMNGKIEEGRIIEESAGSNEVNDLHKSPLPITVPLNNNTSSDLDNVFAQFVSGPNDPGDVHRIPEVEIGGGNSCERDSGAMVPYTG